MAGTYDLQLYFGQIDEFIDLARAFPDKQIILTHTGIQCDRPHLLYGWRHTMKRLAGATNMACKISGLGIFTSNFPADKIFSCYGGIFDAFKRITESIRQQGGRRNSIGFEVFAKAAGATCHGNWLSPTACTCCRNDWQAPMI